MIYKIVSNKPLALIKEELSEHAKESGFGVLGSYEFKKILASKGHPIDKDITVYELCNPVVAQEALMVLPEISVYLPCRLSLYEENGKSILATINIEDMLHSVEVDNDFRLHIQGVFEYLQKLMHSFEE